jgi:hypothetical protein
VTYSPHREQAGETALPHGAANSQHIALDRSRLPDGRRRWRGDGFGGCRMHGARCGSAAGSGTGRPAAESRAIRKPAARQRMSAGHTGNPTGQARSRDQQPTAQQPSAPNHSEEAAAGCPPSITDTYLVRTAAAAGDLLAVASERLRLRVLRSTTAADTSFSVARAFGSDGGLQIVPQNERGG